ncbi:uncharacterized protein LOC123708503 isoform X1 [Pieris brassicae]|uniref:uncharacterized protein LOC123708503 isoform X1 n=1 Tax=Pieris brassicae TaxID=7116 RepID=UPI001E65EE50|nr:uncharacterized protein LOC123708503 isoform X1 [Pieris brassicae]
MSENKNEESNTLSNKLTPQKQNKIRNPFDKVLVERLHQPLSSPGMCKIYKSKSKGTFRWDIEEACTLTPAEIIVCNSQYEASPDPALEKIAEEATEKFFSQELIVPSPMEPAKKQQSLISKTSNSRKCSPNKPQSENSSTQTMLTFPPILPPEIEKILQSFCTFSQEEALFDECERTANGSIYVHTVFTQHDYSDQHYDSEQTDDESQDDKIPLTSYEEHIPVEVSPDLSNNLVSKGMKRTFGTPLQAKSHKPYKNKILNIGDFELCVSPIQFATPKRNENSSSSLSISPVEAGDEEKKLISPEAMATCLDCVHTKFETKGRCFCTPNNGRSALLKESPKYMPKRSSSMTNLNRSRSVQKLDFSMDMSVDGSHNMTQGSETSIADTKQMWSIEDTRQFQDTREIQSSTKLNNFDETPIKGKRRTNVAHEISKIRDSALSPLNMSFENFDIPLSMERKIDFASVDLKFLNENQTVVGESSFKRIDSGFNENTFYASSYYESAIKPSELTISKKALKEISNVNWARVDSGFKEEEFYEQKKCVSGDKENQRDPMSISDYFNEDLTFSCNFSSTPSSSKRKFNF